MALRIIFGKERRDNILKHCPEINNVILGRYPFKCADGVLIAPTDSYPILEEVYKSNVYGFNKIDKDDVVVDVGAHVGIFTLKAARRAKLVIALEPYIPNFKLLLTNIRINRLENVIPINAALGSYNGEAELYVSTESFAHTVSKKTKSLNARVSDKTSKVKLRTLDSLLQELGIKSVSFIKIDAEGAELEILKGASRILLNCKKMKAAIASYHLPKETENVRNFLISRGLKSFYINKGILNAIKI